MHGLWPVGVAIAVRIGLWSFIPSARLASDEDSYLRVGTLLLTTGQQDVFWPPVTGWLIAAIGWVMGSADVRWIRLAWIAMDIANLLAVRALAERVAAAALGAAGGRAARFATLAALAYALYLPAISFSQFATSEIPALLLLLLTLLVLTGTAAPGGRHLVGGVLTGMLSVTRPSLLPLVVVLPAAAAMPWRERRQWAAAAVFVAAASAVILGVVLRNYGLVGQPTIAQNSAYNLYIGNQDLYAEDLDLFHPVATPGQIEFRRQFFSGELQYPNLSPAEMQSAATEWIRAHPASFVRRALGRLARVFAPKTDVLELLGGERAAGIFSPASLTLLAVTNLQWIVVLLGGIVGLAALRRLSPPLGTLFLATVLGSLPLCLVAISKPRYAFGFEPLLLIAALLVLVARARVFAVLRRRDRWTIAACALFLVWGWTAWIVFAVSSRVALASGS